MEYKNGDNLIQQITVIAIVYKDEELVKHFDLETAKILRKFAGRIEEAYKRIEDESKTKTE